MKEAVERMDMSDLAEVKALAKHKDELCEVLGITVFILFDLEKLDKETWKRHFLEPEFLKKLKTFDGDNITEKMMTALDAHFADPRLSVENIESFVGPHIVKQLSKWLWAARRYGQNAKDLRPKIDQLAQLHAELETLQREQASAEFS